MEKIILFLTVLCFALTSCTKEKTDYEAEIDSIVPERSDFKEAYTMTSGNYNIHIEALNGVLYTGYNEIRLKITALNSGSKVEASTMTFHPILKDTQGTLSSCPHRYDLLYKPETGYFEGYAVFTDESNALNNWELNIGFVVAGQQQVVKQKVSIAKQDNKNLNMTLFTGLDGEKYIIALIAPQKPKVAENDLIAGIYKRSKSTDIPTYDTADGYTLLLDPRMPESSMGNHSSPNNKDLTQRQDGLYQGVVNYTMTGNWTLNFMMINQHGRIIKGTNVPHDFTPGVEGVKSDLHIDILF